MTDAELIEMSGALLSLQAEIERMRRVCVDAYWEGMKSGRDMERAAVVAWLRGRRAVAISDLLAVAIERGEHRREEKP